MSCHSAILKPTAAPEKEERKEKWEEWEESRPRKKSKSPPPESIRITGRIIVRIAIIHGTHICWCTTHWTFILLIIKLATAVCTYSTYVVLAVAVFVNPVFHGISTNTSSHRCRHGLAWRYTFMHWHTVIVLLWFTAIHFIPPINFLAVPIYFMHAYVEMLSKFKAVLYNESNNNFAAVGKLNCLRRETEEQKGRFPCFEPIPFYKSRFAWGRLLSMQKKILPKVRGGIFVFGIKRKLSLIYLVSTTPSPWHAARKGHY